MLLASGLFSCPCSDNADGKEALYFVVYLWTFDCLPGNACERHHDSASRFSLETKAWDLRMIFVAGRQSIPPVPPFFSQSSPIMVYRSPPYLGIGVPLQFWARKAHSVTSANRAPPPPSSLPPFPPDIILLLLLLLLPSSSLPLPSHPNIFGRSRLSRHMVNV